MRRIAARSRRLRATLGAHRPRTLSATGLRRRFHRRMDHNRRCRGMGRGGARRRHALLRRRTPEILRHPHRQTPHRAVAPRPRRGIAPRHDLPLPNHAAGRAPRRGQQARHTGRGVRQRHTQTRTVQSHDARPVQGADRMLGRERHPRTGLDPAAASGRRSGTQARLRLFQRRHADADRIRVGAIRRIPRHGRGAALAGRHPDLRHARQP